MNCSEYKVEITLTEPMLGSAPADPEVYAQFIAAKRLKDAPAALVAERTKNQEEVVAEEVALLPDPEQVDSGVTVFRRKDGHLIMMDFQIRGFLKEAAEAISGGWGTRSKIDKWCFVTPRTIPIMRDGQFITKPDKNLERPLRAMTMQGPRVALASSETINEGATMEFFIKVLPLGEKDKKLPIDKEHINDWLEYGSLNGLGQWRTGSYGRFSYRLIEFQKVQPLPVEVVKPGRKKSQGASAA